MQAFQTGNLLSVVAGNGIVKMWWILHPLMTINFFLSFCRESWHHCKVLTFSPTMREGRRRLLILSLSFCVQKIICWINLGFPRYLNMSTYKDPWKNHFIVLNSNMIEKFQCIYIIDTDLIPKCQTNNITGSGAF